jgi:hypothetical protein
MADNVARRTCIVKNLSIFFVQPDLPLFQVKGTAGVRLATGKLWSRGQGMVPGE